MTTFCAFVISCKNIIKPYGTDIFNSLRSLYRTLKKHSRGIWRGCESEAAAADLAALYLPLQDTGPEMIQLSFSQQQLYQSSPLPALLYLLMMMMMMMMMMHKHLYQIKEHTCISGSFLKMLYIFLFGNQKMKTAMAAMLFLCSIWQSCNTRRAGCGEGAQKLSGKLQYVLR